jgi:four helix bundle protein
MTLDAYHRSLDLLRALGPSLARLEVVDRDLSSQCRRAAQSVALNIAEGERRTLRDRRNRFRIALGSAAEVTACLEIAVAIGLLDTASVAPALELADRIRAMTHRLAS